MFEIGKRYFIPSAPIKILPFIGWGMRSGDIRDKTWAEFEVIEDRYKIADGYKIELQSINPQFGRETFYQRDFKDLIKAGCIIEKTNEHQHVKHIKWAEPLLNGINLIHEADIVVDD
jgi:hypothetical protein